VIKEESMGRDVAPEKLKGTWSSRSGSTLTIPYWIRDRGSQGHVFRKEEEWLERQLDIERLK